MGAVTEQPGTPASPAHPAGRKNVFAMIGAGLWMAILAFGGVPLWIYGSKAGPAANTVRRWPADSRVARTPDKPTLIVFAHPKCPCTAATLSELRAVLSRFGPSVDALMLFVRPDGADDAWCHDDLWHDAGEIPGLRLEVDPGGLEAERFGARTSGHVMLYATNDELRFSGGITHARGDAGDDGHTKPLIDAIKHATPRPSDGPTDDGVFFQAPVFGCLLLDRTR